MIHIHYRCAEVDGLDVFYREAGDPRHPTLLLLHGFPTSGHMFRDLIPLLSDRFHLVAPDLPGFGLTSRPAREEFSYSFDNLAKIIQGFTDVLGLDRYALYVFDYGAPVGFRLAMARPDRVSAIVSQNGNAYEAGLGDAWDPIQRYWHEPSEAHRDALREFLSPELIRWQYEHGVADKTQISPDGSALDAWYTQRPGVAEIQLDLFLDYQSNVKLYPAFQRYLREHQPRVLAIWGDKDPFFLPPGAHAFKEDVPEATVILLDTGHFALETHAAEISEAIRGFLPG